MRKRLRRRQTSKKRKTLQRILLIDGNNICAKFTHVLRGLTTPEGTPVGALYGVVGFLRNFIAARPHDSLIVAVDDTIPKFRKKVCPEYKEHREEERKKDKDKEEFFKEYRTQLKILPRVLLPLGVHFARAPGYEADDVIGAFVLRRYRSFHKTILSEDKDLIQLVGEHCFQYRTSTKEMVQECPVGYVIQRALMGDPSDGIKGVSQVGAVRSSTMTESCGTDRLDEFLRMLDPEDRYEGKVLEAADIVRRNVRIMDLRRTARKANLKVRFTQGVPDRAAFKDVCSEFHLERFLKSTRYYFVPFEKSSKFFEGEAG